MIPFGLSVFTSRTEKVAEKMSKDPDRQSGKARPVCVGFFGLFVTEY
jgi:hypothetical protein